MKGYRMTLKNITLTTIMITGVAQLQAIWPFSNSRTPAQVSRTELLFKLVETQNETLAQSRIDSLIGEINKDTKFKKNPKLYFLIANFYLKTPLLNYMTQNGSYKKQATNFLK